ncbi:unannotated protein [freshwater metagenome]|uniref:Unannotated protein n=1 Tax=freshwater metagenome TaxID=449393 RepID=A0A6J6Y6C9_9ZZZZ
MGFGCEVHHRVVTSHRCHHVVLVTDIALDEMTPTIVDEIADVLEVARIRERVVHRDRVVGGGQHVADVVRTNEPGSAGNELLHVRIFQYGRRPTGRSARNGFASSRAERMGSVTPQSPAIAGSFHITPSSSCGL